MARPDLVEASPARLDLASTIERERRAIDFGWRPLSIFGLPVRVRLPASMFAIAVGLGLARWARLSCPARSPYPADDPDQQARADEASNEVPDPSP
jgi:hypothetical protein